MSKSVPVNRRKSACDQLESSRVSTAPQSSCTDRRPIVRNSCEQNNVRPVFFFGIFTQYSLRYIIISYRSRGVRGPVKSKNEKPIFRPLFILVSIISNFRLFFPVQEPIGITLLFHRYVFTNLYYKVIYLLHFYSVVVYLVYIM